MRDKFFYYICLVIILVVLFSDFYVKESPSFFKDFVGSKVELTGIVVDEPDLRENNQKLIVEIGSTSREVKVLVTTNLGEKISYGDELIIEGKLLEPENFITNTGKEFDYVNYLKKDGIFFTINYADIEVVSHNNANIIRSKLFSFKEAFLEKINFAVPEPESLLMGGLILGEKASFSEELRQKFIDTGTIHIVALSGYNITIVAEWFMKFFSFLPQYFGIGIGVLSIILFILMTGGASTAVRAGIMAVLVLIARITGRTYDVGRALLLTAVIMIINNPMILRYDVSFQLSFIATIGVIYFTPKVEKYFMWVPKKFGLREVLSVTTAAYLFVLPFVVYKMGNLSLIAVPANIFILPFVPITMLLGFITGLAGLIWYPISLPFGYLSYQLLHYELKVIDIFSNVSFASFTIPNLPLIIVIIIYAYFFYKLFWKEFSTHFTLWRK